MCPRILACPDHVHQPGQSQDHVSPQIHVLVDKLALLDHALCVGAPTVRLGGGAQKVLVVLGLDVHVAANLHFRPRRGHLAPQGLPIGVVRCHAHAAEVGVALPVGREARARLGGASTLFAAAPREAVAAVPAARAVLFAKVVVLDAPAPVLNGARPVVVARLVPEDRRGGERERERERNREKKERA